MACDVTYSTHVRRGEPACPDCLREHSKRVKTYELARLLGRPTTDLVDADPVRAHLAKFEALGVNAFQVGRIAGLERTVIHRIMGRASKPAAARVHKPTADAILAVPLPTHAEILDLVSDRTLICAVGTRRRLQALATLGWSIPAIHERCGVGVTSLGNIIRGKVDTVQGRVGRVIRDVYRDLMLTEAPTRTGYERNAVSRIKARAHRNGWASPLMWEDIDDPTAEPTGGEVRTGKGTRRRASQAERVEDFLYLVGHGVAAEEALVRTGLTRPAVERVGHKERRPELLRALGVNTAIGVHRAA